MNADPGKTKVPAAPRDNEGRGKGRRKFTHRFDENAPTIAIGVRREICRRIATGATMKQLEEDPRLPRRQHIYNLIWRDPEFKRMYVDARRARALAKAEELSDLAATAAVLDNIPEKKSNAYVQAIRLQVDTEKWLLSKIIPEDFGDELPKEKGKGAIEGVLEIVRAVAQLARDKPVPAQVVIPAISDSEKN